MSADMRKVKLGDSKVAIGYLRVSTDEQKLGPDAQRASIQAWAERQGTRVVAWHTDRISGSRELDDRPGLGAALGELRARNAGLLLVAKRDRLARDSAIAIATERAVKACGGQVVSADGAGNGVDAADEFMRRILDAAAEYERALIRARTKAALAVKRARGLCVGNIQFGYRLAADGKTLEPDTRESAVVERMVALRGQGLTLAGIAERLNGENLAPRTALRWVPQQVARILARRAA